MTAFWGYEKCDIAWKALGRSLAQKKSSDAAIFFFFFSATTTLGHGLSWVLAGTREEGDGSLFKGVKPFKTTVC